MKQTNIFLHIFKIMLFSGILVATASARAELKVVTTIKPLHSLISNVMDGIGEPGLIIDGSISPHSFTMKPSHAKMLEEADVIFWIGEGIETSMEEPLDSIAKDAEVIEFMELDSIAKLKFREESIFGDHDDHDDHDDHAHGAHAFEWAGLFDLKAGTYKWSAAKVDGDYADPAMKLVLLAADDIEAVEETAEELLESKTSAKKTNGGTLVAKEIAYSLNFDDSQNMTVFTVEIAENGKYAFFTEHMPFEFEANEHFFKDTSGADIEPIAQEPEMDGHDHHDHHGHAHGEFDAHIWLDPMNAKEMVHEIAHELGDLDPANKEKYEANAEATIKALDQLISDVGTDINSDAKFVVFHDAYQYFEERFGVRAAGALTLNTDVLPGAKQIADIQDVIKDKGIKCIFSEPQFNPKIITTIAEDMNIKTGVFDPLGANIDAGKSLYFTLISNLGNELKGC